MCPTGSAPVRAASSNEFSMGGHSFAAASRARCSTMGTRSCRAKSCVLLGQKVRDRIFNLRNGGLKINNRNSVVIFGYLLDKMESSVNPTLRERREGTGVPRGKDGGWTHLVRGVHGDVAGRAQVRACAWTAWGSARQSDTGERDKCSHGMGRTGADRGAAVVVARGTGAGREMHRTGSRDGHGHGEHCGGRGRGRGRVGSTDWGSVSELTHENMLLSNRNGKHV